ncbi:MAG: NUDIX hydrolase N-terminal domain-containing protein [Candidatus Hodarchaeales archaeon]|jgi:ADP-ribose pyrophosphatase YjhB (NUDIX family)
MGLPAKQIAFWADQLRDLAAQGLLYSTNSYDKERYAKIQQLVIEMLTFSTNWSEEDLIPLRETLFPRPSPILTGDAAIINETGQILLIQRSDNHLWAMPGGMLEVGETPSEGVLREVFEETGLRCKVKALVGLFDSRLCGTVYPLQLYHVVFLCKPKEDIEAVEAPHKHESLDKQWFDEHNLPVNIDPGHISRIPEAFRLWHGDLKPFFDYDEY